MTITWSVKRQTKAGGARESRGAVPELTPWREVGWIFRDGGCVAVERRGDETRVRTPVD